MGKQDETPRRICDPTNTIPIPDKPEECDECGFTTTDLKFYDVDMKDEWICPYCEVSADLNITTLSNMFNVLEKRIKDFILENKFSGRFWD